MLFTIYNLKNQPALFFHSTNTLLQLNTSWLSIVQNLTPKIIKYAHRYKRKQNRILSSCWSPHLHQFGYKSLLVDLLAKKPIGRPIGRLSTLEELLNRWSHTLQLDHKRLFPWSIRKDARISMEWQWVNREKIWFISLPLWEFRV